RLDVERELDPGHEDHPGGHRGLPADPDQHEPGDGRPMSKPGPRPGIGIALLAAGCLLAPPARADDKDLLRQGQSNPTVVIIVSNTFSRQYLPYVQGTTPTLPADGQYQDSPVSKFGLAKGAINSVVQLNSGLFNFGLSWYSYHQEVVTRKHWTYRF